MSDRRDLVGYLIGFVLFVVLVPGLMWLTAGDVEPSLARIVACAILAAAGLGLSVWSIVYMRAVGKGNPMDAFNHELAPRTSVLMTEGPYALCRNPMLLGVLAYYLGLVILLGSVKAAIVFASFAAVMAFQVFREEQRLTEDFGEAYVAYQRRTKRLIPFVW